MNAIFGFIADCILEFIVGAVVELCQKKRKATPASNRFSDRPPEVETGPHRNFSPTRRPGIAS
jgi:hypothetical protein